MLHWHTTGSLDETVAGDEVAELDSVGISCTLKPDVDITGEHNWIHKS